MPAKLIITVNVTDIWGKIWRSCILRVLEYLSVQLRRYTASYVTSMSMLSPPPSNLSMVCKHYYSHELAIKYLVRQNKNIS